MQNIIGHFGPKALKCENVQLQVPITFSYKIQMMQNLRQNWSILELASLKQKGLNFGQF